MANSTIDLMRENIRKYRNLKGLTQVQLALNAGLSENYIYEIENGRKTPSLKRLILIADALKIDIKNLFE